MMNNKMIEAVGTGNVTMMRSVLKSCISQDPNFSRGVYQDTLAYALGQGVNEKELFDPFDGEAFETKDKWNKDYFNSVMGALLFNFSKERIEHIKQVGKVLYPVVVQKSPEISKGDSKIKAQSKDPLKKYMPLLVAGGIIVLLLILIIALLRRN